MAANCHFQPQVLQVVSEKAHVLRSVLDEVNFGGLRALLKGAQVAPVDDSCPVEVVSCLLLLCLELALLLNKSVLRRANVNDQSSIPAQTLLPQLNGYKVVD